MDDAKDPPPCWSPLPVNWPHCTALSPSLRSVTPAHAGVVAPYGLTKIVRQSSGMVEVSRIDAAVGKEAVVDQTPLRAVISLAIADVRREE